MIQARNIAWTYNAMYVKADSSTRKRKRIRSSNKERMVDALALRADERRDKLRKVTGRSKYPLIRECLNGETHMRRPHVPHGKYIAMRREPGELKHLSSRRKRKKIFDFHSSGERNGKSPNRGACTAGLGPQDWFIDCSWMVLERPTIEGESPVSETGDGMAVSRVLRDTRNLAGMSGDHPVRLNTP